MPADLSRKAWLGLVNEPVIDPERRIVDPHHHLWAGFGPRADPYFVPELLEDLRSGHRIEQTVFMECYYGYRAFGPEELRSLGETTFVASQSKILTAIGGPPIGGIVGTADLRVGASVAAVLELHMREGEGKFRGIRQGAAYDPDKSVPSHSPVEGVFYGEPAYREGVSLLGKMGLVLDVFNYHPHIKDVAALARACPGTQIVLDHYGAPLGIGPYADRRAEVFKTWAADIAELSKCPNVVVKLGGLVMDINGFGWTKRERPPTSEELAASQRPYFQHVIETFGPARAMFESNFPVDKLSCSYRVLWNAFKRMSAELSESEKDDLFRGTAMRIYKLPPAA